MPVLRVRPTTVFRADVEAQAVLVPLPGFGWMVLRGRGVSPESPGAGRPDGLGGVAEIVAVAESPAGSRPSCGGRWRQGAMRIHKGVD